MPDWLNLPGQHLTRSHQKYLAWNKEWFKILFNGFCWKLVPFTKPAVQPNKPNKISRDRTLTIRLKRAVAFACGESSISMLRGGNPLNWSCESKTIPNRSRCPKCTEIGCRVQNNGETVRETYRRTILIKAWIQRDWYWKVPKFRFRSNKTVVTEASFYFEWVQMHLTSSHEYFAYVRTYVVLHASISNSNGLLSTS